MTKNEYMNQISLLLGNGKFADAKSLLNRFRKSKKTNVKDKIYISECYYTMGENERAIKIVGKRVNFNKYHLLTDEKLMLQFLLAVYLGTAGSSYISRYILKYFLEELEKRNLRPTKVVPRYHNHLMSLKSKLYQGYDNSKELVHAENDYQNSDFMCFFAYFLSARAAFEVGDTKAIDELLLKMKKLNPTKGTRLYAFLIQTQARRAFSADNFTGAITFYEIALKEKLVKGERCLLLLESARCYFELKKKALAKKCLDEGHQLSVDLKNPRLIKYAIALKEFFGDENLTLNEKLYLRCQICFSPYSRLVGSPQGEKENSPLWVEKVFKADSNNCWYLKDGEISRQVYNEVSKELTGNGDFIDLKSSCIGSSSDGSIGTLTELQTRCLLAALTAGKFGIHILALSDFIFREEYFSLDSIRPRLYSIIKQIEKFGIKFSVKNNMYFCETDKIFNIVIPDDYTKFDPIYLYGNIHSRFSRKSIEKFFSIHKATANRWISNWKEEHLISIAEIKGKETIFTKAF